MDLVSRGRSKNIFLKNWVLNLDVQFARFGAKFTDTYNVNFNYLSVPIGLGYDLYRNEQFGFEVHYGFSPSLFLFGALDAGSQSTKYKVGKDISAIDLFWNLGAGFNFYQSESLILKANIDVVRGLLDIKGTEDSDISSIRNKAILFSVGILKRLVKENQ